MDIYDVIGREVSSGSEYYESEDSEESVYEYNIINIIEKSPVFKKTWRPLPTVQEAIADLTRILNAQKFRVWRLIRRAATADEFENDSA
jgi:hypothetical protein